MGPETADDGGVYRLGPELAIINTVDFFTPIVDDPYWFGAIAAANALSDVYSMGGTPLTALNIVCFPAQEYPLEVLEAILQGSAMKFQEAGCVVVGGHSIQDAELKYGAAVTGVVHPEQMVTNAGARPGDRLILTKRLGTGIVTTGIKRGMCSSALEEEVSRAMAELNRAASQVMLRHRVHACTDITGFGLVGHAYEMARASGVALHLQAQSLPLFPEALALAEEKVGTRGWKGNRAYVGENLHWAPDLTEPWQRIATEAETSGGLLMAIPEEEAEAALAELHQAGVVHARIVGWVEAEPAGHVFVG